MSEFVTIALLVGVSAFALRSWLVLRHSKSEYYRLDFSLQHERYSNRLTVDFMHAVKRSLETGEAQEVTKDTVFRSILFTAIRGTRAMSVCIFRLNEDDAFEPIARAGLFPLLGGYPARFRGASRVGLIRAHFEKTIYAKDAPCFAEALRSGTATLVRAFPLAPGNFVPDDPPAVPRDVIVAPVFLSGKLIGVIAVANPRHRGRFTPSEIKLADLLAQQAGMALQMRTLLAVRAEKQRLDFELGIAASIQKMLLPRYIPQAHSIDIATTYRPAQTVGGDLYDVFDLGGGRIAAVVADVSGHGISAALLMAICRTNFQHVARSAISAADLLRGLNRAMMHSFKRGMFVTIVCAFIDTQRNTLSVARGGHERPVLVSNHLLENGKTEIEFLDSKGLAIGISKPEVFDSAITEISRTYSRGDVLVFYTDGLTEALDEHGEEFGAARLKAAVEKAHALPAAEINDAVIRDLKAFCGGNEPADDLTLVTIRAI